MQEPPIAAASLEPGSRRQGTEGNFMTLHAPLEVSARESGGVHYLQVHGRLTIGEPSEHLNEFTQQLLERGARKMVINLNDIPQIDSSGISSLVKLSICLARQGGGLHLVCGPGRVRDALTVTRLIEAIPTFDSEASASASF
jgi:anti-anti-sigma factor